MSNEMMHRYVTMGTLLVLVDVVESPWRVLAVSCLGIAIGVVVWRTKT